jgi:hypothetical protein
MRKYKSGLHKDVPEIFGGVWNPETDSSVVHLEPEPQAVYHWPQKHRSVGLLRACKDVSGFIFRSRARRERKRLTSISKHLMINITSRRAVT